LFYLLPVFWRTANMFVLVPLSLAGIAGCQRDTARPAKAPHARPARKTASDVPAEKTASKRPPCTFGADQTCNEDKSVSTLWGYCTSLGVCECNHGFEVSPTSHLCRPAR
jgi:curli biogenesis system outer membrane secretion channel CsgG